MLNQALKSKIVWYASQHFGAQVAAQLKRGIPANEVRLDTRLSTLKDPFVAFIGQAVVDMQGKTAQLEKGFRHLSVAFKPSAKRDQLYKKAQEMNEAGELFTGKANSVHATIVPGVPGVNHVENPKWGGARILPDHEALCAAQFTAYRTEPYRRVQYCSMHAGQRRHVSERNSIPF